MGLLPNKFHPLALNLELCSPNSSEKVEEPFSVKETEYLEKVMIQNTRQYDATLNVMIIGDTGVGKTSLMNAWLNSENPLMTKHTIGYIFNI